MKILVVNAGSSSVKFSLFDMAPPERCLASGVVERIGLADPCFSCSVHGKAAVKTDVRVTDTRQALDVITRHLVDAPGAVLASREEIAAVGHRVVHGGERVGGAVVVDARVKAIIDACATLAPLHNPPNLRGIEACEDHFPRAVQVAVFDTAFHATLPEHAYLYALPYRYYRQDKIRRYGFHGTSHRYVCRQAARYLKRPLADLKLVSCHLGNGSSVTAVDGGKSVDTSMGMTPLEGTIMGSRCGDIDPAIIFRLMREKGLDAEGVSQLLNRESGIMGLAGIGSSDFRDITAAMATGNRRAKMAVDVYAYRVRKYIGAYAFAMGGLDAVIFTAGIGENSPLLRRLICRNLEGMGIVLDEAKNENGAGRRHFHADRSRVSLLVVPTDEEKAIAQETRKVLTG